ncbi:MAG: branched-chain amino acid ABC transporter permease, partial [Dehalococcoidia bacterium]|nr:branched-chain amino acid ABC transporter permease [Dehalococcoidia bacterium]
LLSSWFTYWVIVQRGLPPWLGFIIVIIFALFLGWVIERIILRPLIAQPILSLITVTLGLAYFIRGLVVFAWPTSVAGFSDSSLAKLFPPEPVHFGPAVVTQPYLWATVISLALFVLLTLYFRYSRMGIAMRATADDQKAVQACGIPVTRIFSQSWMFACVLAAVGGVLMSSIGGVTMGLVETGLKSFSVVILGGLDSFLGAMLAGPIIGLAENLGDTYLTRLGVWEGLKEIIPFIVIIIVMFIRPYGLLGEERIERI